MTWLHEKAIRILLSSSVITISIKNLGHVLDTTKLAIYHKRLSLQSKTNILFYAGKNGKSQ